MVTTNATKTFLDWIHSTRFEDIPADVRHTTVLALYDDTECNLASGLLKGIPCDPLSNYHFGA